jgi:hypothetical protein
MHKSCCHFPVTASSIMCSSAARSTVAQAAINTLNGRVIRGKSIRVSVAHKSTPSNRAANVYVAHLPDNYDETAVKVWTCCVHALHISALREHLGVFSQFQLRRAIALCFSLFSIYWKSFRARPRTAPVCYHATEVADFLHDSNVLWQQMRGAQDCMYHALHR